MNINFSLFGQAITFGIFVWFTMKVVWPPLIQAMDDRRKKIADGLEAGERGRLELAEASRHAEEKLRDARVQAVALLEEAQQQANGIIDEAKKKAKVEAQRIIDSAQGEIQQEVVRAREALRSQVVSIAMGGAEKVLGRSIDANAHRELLDQLANDLGR